MIDNTLKLSLNRKVKLVDGKKIQLTVLDDHPVVTLGTCALLNAQPDMAVLSHCNRTDELMRTLRSSTCEVAVVDFYMPGQSLDGAGLIRHLRINYPQLIIVVHTGGDPVELEYASYRAGANAFLAKKEKIGCLVDIVRCTREHPRQFFALRTGTPIAVTPTRGDEELTVGEIEVLRQLASGLSVMQIARKSYRSKQTISTHKRRAMTKLKIKDELALALYLNEKFTG